jgi:hypothetical protein
MPFLISLIPGLMSLVAQLLQAHSDHMAITPAPENADAHAATGSALLDQAKAAAGIASKVATELGADPQVTAVLDAVAK